MYLGGKRLFAIMLHLLSGGGCINRCVEKNAEVEAATSCLIALWIVWRISAEHCLPPSRSGDVDPCCFSLLLLSI